MFHALVIGVGNPERGDDAAGRLVARRLLTRKPENTAVREVAGEATEIMSLFAASDAVFLIDACCSGARPGTVVKYDLDEEVLPHAVSSHSTHGFGVAQAVELARTFGTLPKRCILYAIEGARFEPGTGLSPDVANALEDVVQAVESELRDFGP